MTTTEAPPATTTQLFGLISLERDSRRTEVDTLRAELRELSMRLDTIGGDR